jgi:hypothetical protein
MFCGKSPFEASNEVRSHNAAALTHNIQKIHHKRISDEAMIRTAERALSVVYNHDRFDIKHGSKSSSTGLSLVGILIVLVNSPCIPNQFRLLF